MATIEVTTFSLPATDGGAIFVRAWSAAETEPTAVVAIAHGVSEHGERYDRIARALASHGFRTYASDHRGHGRTASGALGDAGPAGWHGILDDVLRVVDHAVAETPGVPVFLLGHSMGSIAAQRFIALHGERLAGAILSGTVVKLADPGLVETARAAAEAAPSEPSSLFGGMFASFNAPFAGATGFEWLSRDTIEVKKYVDDPLSGTPLTNATLADFLPGWAEAASDETRARVPRSLPVLLISGAHDPAGGNGSAPTELAEAYRANGARDVTLRLYPEARHELFNETIRDEVERDVVAWIDAHR